MDTNLEEIDRLLKQTRDLINALANLEEIDRLLEQARDEAIVNLDRVNAARARVAMVKKELDRSPERQVPPSVQVLREADGPLGLRAICERTARRTGVTSRYEDVLAVLEAARDRGEVRLVHDALDWRDQAWEVIR